MNEDPEVISATELFRRHARFVARFVVRYGVQREDVDDVVQEVFLVAHAHGGYHRGPAKPTSWLAAIAMRLASSHRQRLSVRAFAREDARKGEETASETPTPEIRMMLDRAMHRLHEVLRTLTPEQRLTFILFELEDESCTSIAAATGVPVGTVYSRLHFARRRLVNQLTHTYSASSVIARDLPWMR